ncbi:MAG: 8-oxo-dGTP diphosphatase [Paenibacillaceae bacterium]
MSNPINYKVLTLTMVLDKDRVLLLNRPDRLGFPGYIAPGGKVDYPESIVDGAMREVYEETGLVVNEIVYKGLSEFCDPTTSLRYMVFNYLATSFEGELLDNPPEGELLWVHLNEISVLPMQHWFRDRIPLFFQPGTFEHHVVWDSVKDENLNEIFRKYAP